MPYEEHKTKAGVTVTAKDTGKSYHVSSPAAAKKLEQQHEMFKHMNETLAAKGKMPKTRGGK